MKHESLVQASLSLQFFGVVGAQVPPVEQIPAA
jgi:hypothetical protein